MENNVTPKKHCRKNRIAARARTISALLSTLVFCLITVLAVVMGKGMSNSLSKNLLSLLIAIMSAPVLYALAANTIIRRFLFVPHNCTAEGTPQAGSPNCHEHLLHTVKKISGVLLTAEDETFEVSFQEGMELLAYCLSVDRITIWQNELINGALHYSLHFRWANDTAVQRNSIPANNIFSYSDIPAWEALFSKAECISGTLARLSQIERDRLGLYGMKSIFAVPVFLRDYFWGFVSFEDCRKERSFTETEIAILRSGSQIMVSSLNRNAQAAEVLKTQDLRDTMMQTVNNVATLLLQSETDEFEGVLRRCMSMIGAAVDADRVYIWKNHIVDGRLVSSQLSEWSETVPPQQNTEYAVNISYDNTMPDWEDTLAKGYCVNGIVRELSAEAQAQLLPQGIVSILIVPVFLRDEFWGFVGFDDCINERVFSESEETILRSASLLIANALLRNKMTLDMRNAAAQLELALEKAQAASSAKSNFLSNMSHEMRTPMSAIIGMTMIGKSASDIEKKNYAFEKIEEASKHLLGVINDVLDMSKIEADKFELFSAEFDFEKLLHKATGIINFRLEEKHQRLSVYIDPDIPQTLIGDDQRLLQVLANLLSNAVKFTPEQGSIALDAHFLNEANGLCTIQVAVTDTGIGISAEQQSRLFTSFEQAESSTSRKFGGTGLGLAICKSIVSLMGGSIWVESELDSGAAFVFTIQLKKQIGVTTKPEETAETVPEQEISFSGCRILLAEDLEINREIVAAMLEPLCLDIDFAANGREALRMFRAGPEKYDLIFMDLQMPEMDGFEAARRIRAIDSQKAREIPIVAMTANVFKEDIDKCLETGMNGHVGKPLDIGEIVEILRVYLRPQGLGGCDS